MVEEGMINKDPYAAIDDYNEAILSGIVKIASKMGISTIQSYQGSQIFEAVGISSDVINKYFTGTVSPVEGITLDDIEESVDKLHSTAFDPLELDVDLTLEVQVTISLEVERKSINIIRQQFIHFRWLHGQTTISYLNSTHI